jgi:hypothetical protein
MACSIECWADVRDVDIMLGRSLSEIFADIIEIN